MGLSVRITVRKSKSKKEKRKKTNFCSRQELLEGREVEQDGLGGQQSSSPKNGVSENGISGGIT